MSVNTSNILTNRLVVTALLCVVVLFFTACSGGGDSQVTNPPVSETEIPTPVPAPVPTPTEVGLAKLHTQGTQWRQSDDSAIILKGTNLGNWLLQEFWMMNQSANTEATDQCRLEAKLDERFGFAERERLMDIFRDNWITERDWDIMQSFGLNVIRLPFIWNLIEDENNPKTLRSDAWQYLDYAIEKAEEYGMYVILDLHGAVGAQGLQDHSGCAGQNLYWGTPEYQDRTIWLWQQIAQRYKDNGTVAAYGLLNEPWGTDASNLADVMMTLHDAVRETDPEKIIVLPGHNSGIDEYGSPDSFGGTNIAFEMHFYPGIFGWGEPNYETHRDWLACGKDGNSGVCEWNARMQGLDSPLLIGEFQPWANLGIEFGAKNARASYDKYAEFDWAATSWSYKVLTANGDQGQGTWGMVTNKKSELGLVAKSSTWVCPGWDSSFENGCETSADTISPTLEGLQTYYLIVKFGACCDGNLDTAVDNISLKDELGNELVLNGNFGTASNWTIWNASGAPSLDFNYTEASRLPTNSDGPVLRMSGNTNTSVTEINGGIYQSIILEGGKDYSFSGVFKDNGSADSWAEFFIVSEQPIDGVDVLVGDSVPGVDFANAPIEEIESVFQLYGTVEYDIHQPLLAAMTSDSPTTLYTLPNAPTGLALYTDNDGVGLGWNANVETDVIGYNVYRRSDNSADFQLIAEKVDSVVYVDITAANNITYYYKIAAVDAEDISYLSNEVVTGLVANELPGLIQAENWTAMSGFQVEATTDSGGGNNVGFADPGDWLEYSVNISQAGNYLVEYRLASQDGSNGFTVSVNGDVIDTVVVANTGGWQTWATQSNTVDLPAGEHTIKVDALDEQWNLNWINFSLSTAPTPTPAPLSWQLVWADEFNGETIDSANWEHQVFPGAGSGNEELQYYTDRTVNSRIEDDTDNPGSGNRMLVIEAHEESPQYLGHDYSSARLHTAGKQDFLYGRIEARIKIPSGQGYWPAFWMLPTDWVYGGWAASGEIDILEAVNVADTVHGTLHYGGEWPDNQNSGCAYNAGGGINFGDDFHTYAIEWEPSEFRWYVDGNLFCTRTNDSWFSDDSPSPAPFDQPFHILLNVAVGGTWPGSPSSSTVFPQKMWVDYVRVSQIPNEQPSVNLTNPTTSTTLPTGNNTLQASAVDTDGTIKRVKFFVNGQFLAQDTTAPYSYDWDAVDGCYEVRIDAIDDLGGLASDVATDVTVGIGCPVGPFNGTPLSIPGIIEAEDFDLGPAGVSYSDTSMGNEGGAYRTDVDVDMEVSNGGGVNVGWIADNEFINYTVQVVSAGDYNLKFFTASPTGGGVIHVKFDGVDVTGPIVIPQTGGWQTWSTTSVNIPLTQGEQVMTFVAETTIGVEFNLDYFDFTAN
jgi:endoglucanase